ncbi:MAG: hypothetical protein C0622_03325 [Desulfuromonas sp.]|nr:MAG: hypothetical protein C0622_03325 [Desulfuromonas sp.]
MDHNHIIGRAERKVDIEEAVSPNGFFYRLVDPVEKPKKTEVICILGPQNHSASKTIVLRGNLEVYFPMTNLV